MIIAATFLLLSTVAGICAVLFVVAVIQSWREKRMLAALPPRLPANHCVQEAERILFRYQYRLTYGQPLDEAL